MIIDENYLEIQDQTDLLAQQLVESAAFKQLIDCQAQMTKSIAVQTAMEEFLTAKSVFDQIKEYGQQAPDYQQRFREVNRRKRALDLLPEVSAYRVAELDFQTILDEIAATLAKSISPEIKIDTGNPFFETGQKKQHNC